MIDWMLRIVITSLLFFPDSTIYERPVDYGLAEESVQIQVNDKTTLHGLFLPAQNEKGILLFLHGNAGNLSGRISKAGGWVERGYSVFLVDYRGYGKSTGKIRHQEDLTEDGRKALEWLEREKNVSSSQIVLYGESVGGYPVVKLATEKKFRAIILESPYTSFKKLAPRHYPMLPAFMIEQLLKDFSFDIESSISKIKAPLFILHGDHDQTVFYEMGQQVFELAPEPKEFFTIEGGAHNNLSIVAGRNFWQKPVDFLEALK